MNTKFVHFDYHSPLRILSHGHHKSTQQLRSYLPNQPIATVNCSIDHQKYKLNSWLMAFIGNFFERLIANILEIFLEDYCGFHLHIWWLTSWIWFEEILYLFGKRGWHSCGEDIIWKERKKCLWGNWRWR